MIKVGIVGMGVIGRHVTEAIAQGIPSVALAGSPCGTRPRRTVTGRSASSG